MVSDPTSAVAMLEIFVNGCNRLAGNSVGVMRAHYAKELTRQIPSARALITAADPTISVQALQVGKPSDPAWCREASHLANLAIGAIRDAEQVQRIIGPTGPRLAARELHPSVWAAAGRLWEDGHLSAAVQRGATAVIGLVRDRTGNRDGQDTDLMNQAFSDQPPAPNRPRLRWPGSDADQTVKSMRSGLRSLAVGLMQTVRNPVTHTTEDLAQDVALEQLAALSMLARMIEECDIVWAPEGSDDLGQRTGVQRT